jgi:hypothetical protein
MLQLFVSLFFVQYVPDHYTKTSIFYFFAWETRRFAVCTRPSIRQSVFAALAA